MDERLVMVPGKNHCLEALFQKGAQPGVAIVCHPHPLYGGAMDNNVVEALVQAFRSWGTGTLRFNFRGVGGSGGSYGNGDGEAGDILAVRDYLRERGEQGPFRLAGYSFGAWAALKALKTSHSFAALTLVAPPLELLDFGGLEIPPIPTLVLLGDEDGFCRPGALREWLKDQAPRGPSPAVHILEGCDHFFGGRELLLKSELTAFLEETSPMSS